MKLIIGLGNPGREYENSFHNMGFKVVDLLSKKLDLEIKKNECSALVVAKGSDAKKIVLAKPQTFMNLSGDAVSALMAKYKAEPKDVLIIYDDIDIPRFSIRVRASGSAGTHNGMKDIVKKTKTTMLPRVRIGIGRDECDLKDFVLSKISKADNENFEKVFDRVTDAIVDYIKDEDFLKLERTLNTKIDLN